MHYVPVFKAKKAELDSIEDLSEDNKSRVFPLIEIPPVPWNHEEGEPSKAPVDHISKMGLKIHKACGSRPVMLDCLMLDDELADGLHPLEYVARSITEKGGYVIPVVRPDSEAGHIAAAKAVIAMGTGVLAAIRITVDDQADTQALAKAAVAKVGELGLTTDLCSLIIDLGDLPPVLGYASAFARQLERDLSAWTWRTFILVTTSFPSNLSDVQGQSAVLLERREWKLFESFRSNPGPLGQPVYGDFGISSVEQQDIDPRYMRMSAALRYTLEEHFLVVKGRNVKQHGFDQIKELCRQLIGTSRFKGSGFSWGDKWIQDCADEKLKTSGNATTWRKVGLTHHLAVVLNQLAT